MQTKRTRFFPATGFGLGRWWYNIVPVGDASGGGCPVRGRRRELPLMLGRPPRIPSLIMTDDTTPAYAAGPLPWKT